MLNHVEGGLVDRNICRLDTQLPPLTPDVPAIPKVLISLVVNPVGIDLVKPTIDYQRHQNEDERLNEE